MTIHRIPLFATLALTFVIAASWLSACGQDVATCATVCGLPGAATTCATACAAQQEKCSSSTDAPNFQAYLTCLGNAGTYSATEGVCAELAAAVSECNGEVYFDAGTSPDTSKQDAKPGTCTLGSACRPGSLCTNQGVGPCGSDERLMCGSGTPPVLVPDGFLCNTSTVDQTPDCTIGGGSCSCTCPGQYEVCTGDCPAGSPTGP
jgi:hypothetical protein